MAQQQYDLFALGWGAPPPPPPPPPAHALPSSPEAANDADGDVAPRKAAEAKPLVGAGWPTHLGEALALYDDAVSDRGDRAQIRSAFRTIGRVLGLPLEQIPAAPEPLSRLLKIALPARAGVKARNWTQSKSRARSGLRALGVDMAPGRASTPLAPAWAALSDTLPDKRLQIGLSRLLHFLSDTGVTPREVTDGAFDAFREELLRRSLLTDAAACLRRTARLWNQAESEVAGWPSAKFAVERHPTRYSLDWNEFPPSLSAEVEAFIHAKAQPDVLDDDYWPATSAATGEGRRGMLRQLSSALVLSGAVPIAEVTGLRMLVQIDNAKAAVRYLMERAKAAGEGTGPLAQGGGKVTPSIVNMVWLLRTIAAKWVKEPELVAPLKRLVSNLTKASGGKAPGMTPKNRERLRQFDVPASLDALIWLPLRILKRVSATAAPDYHASVRLMYALQVGLLTFAPMRSKNLTELKLGENLIDIGKGAQRDVRIFLPAAITKTYQDYEAAVPRHLFPILDAWLAVHRTRICASPSPYLFPNPQGELRSRDALTAKLTRFISRETGLVINAHLFRHIAAKLYLDHDPGGIEIVRQLLGHRSIQTTLRVYAELKALPAFKRLEQVLLQAVDPLQPHSRAGRSNARAK